MAIPIKALSQFYFPKSLFLIRSLTAKPISPTCSMICASSLRSTHQLFPTKLKPILVIAMERLIVCKAPHSGCEIEYTRKGEGYHYKLVFAKSLINCRGRCLFYSVFKFIQIKLSLGDIGWIETDDHYFLFYLIGIYKGWGVILAQTMTDIGQTHDGLWQRTWKYISPMPLPVMAYSLALHSAIAGGQ